MTKMLKVFLVVMIGLLFQASVCLGCNDQTPEECDRDAPIVVGSSSSSGASSSAKSSSDSLSKSSAVVHDNSKLEASQTQIQTIEEGAVVNKIEVSPEIDIETGDTEIVNQVEAKTGDVSVVTGDNSAEGGKATSDSSAIGIQGDFTVQFNEAKNYIGSAAPIDGADIPSVVGDGSEANRFSGIIPNKVSRKRVEHNLPKDHSIQKFLANWIKFARVFSNLDNADDTYVLYDLPQNDSFEEYSKKKTNQLFYLPFADDLKEKDFREKNKAALEKGYVIMYLYKCETIPSLGDKVIIDGDVLLNKIWQTAMDQGMQYYTVDKIGANPFSYGKGDASQNSGSIADTNSLAGRVDLGMHTSKSASWTGKASWFWVYGIVYNPVLAKQLLDEMNNVPMLETNEGPIFAFDIFKGRVNFADNSTALMREEDMLEVDKMGYYLIQNWYPFQEYGLYFAAATNRDERGTPEYNLGLGIKAAKALRKLIWSRPYVQTFVKKEGISWREWKKRFLVFTSGKENPKNSGEAKNDPENRYGFLIATPGL